MPAWLRALDPLAVEAVVLATVAVAGALAPARERRRSRAWHCLAALVRQPHRAQLASGAAAAAVTALLLTVRAPQPRVHDEFGYLLLADTFAHGRLTNPAPLHPDALDTFQVLVSPSYTAKFPPAQGLVLAAGQLLAGDPRAGLWLSAGLAAALLCWALQGWVGYRWALVGTLLAIARLSFTYWSHSFWGGSVAAAGGALVVGSVPRLLARPCRTHGVTLGLGLAILANSRPYEGLMLAIPAVAALAFAAGQAWRGSSVADRPPGAPVAGAAAGLLLVLLPTALAMAHYNRKVTGSALLHPHVAYDRKVGISAFPWMSRPQPSFRHAEMTRFFRDWEGTQAEAHRRPGWIVRDRADKLARLFGFYVGLPLALPLLLALPQLRRRRETRLALGWLLSFVVAVLLPVWLFMHYAAPALALVLVLETEALRLLKRRLRLRRDGRRWRFAVTAVVLALFAGQVVRFARREGHEWRLWPERSWVLRELRESPGRDLVFVAYARDHDVHEEWVYNEASLAEAPVVWVRAQSAGEDQAVERDWPERKAWLLLADERPPRLVPFRPAP